MSPQVYSGSTCVYGMTLAGFEYGPDGRPVIAWREENGCGGTPRVFWTRKDAALWHQLEFFSADQAGARGDYAHQLVLKPGDGHPFLIYAAVGNSNEVNTYRTDLDAHPSGGVSTYIESLVGPQHCAYVNYSPAFGPFDQTPQWTTGLSQCNGVGPVRLNGTVINPAVGNPKASLAIGADKTRHVLWNAGSDVYYSRFPVDAETPDVTTHLFDDLNRFGGEVRIVIDGKGVLHAIVRGPDISADWDLGAIVYLTSTDNGKTWSSRQYVDPHDDPAIQSPWNANSDLSFAVDADGVPAVSFWRWTSELWYARRDGPNGSWTQQLVSALPIVNPVRNNQLRFDPDGTPVIAYFDPAIHMMRLARPVPSGAVIPIDVAVTATASPTVVPSGATTTFTLTVTNKGVTNLDHVVLTNRLPEGATFVSASPAQDTDGDWTFALTSGASTTVTITTTAPFAEGVTADVASVSIDAEDAHPEDNAAAAGLRVQSDQCFVPHGANSELKGWWRGDGSAANAIGTPAESITVFGGVTYEPAVIGSGFKFDGTSGAVHVYHDNDNFYYPVDGSFTIEAFIKTLSPAGQIATRYECRPSCGPTALFLSLDGAGHLSGYLRSAIDALTLQGGRIINDGVFHHVALVIDRATEEAKLYVDGTVDAVMPYTLGTIADSNGPYTPLVIGARFDYYGNNVEFFNGVIDEVAIHGRALSAAEIGQVSSTLSSPVCGPMTPSNGTDVAVTVQGAPASVAPGGNATFLIGVTNNGTTDLLGVNVDNMLGGSATFVDAAPNPQSAIGGFQNFNVGSLARGEQKWIAVRVTAPPVPGTITSQAHHLIDADQNTSNDEARGVVQVVADACFVPPTGLVSRWRGDGNASDDVGTHDGAVQGTATFALGRVRQAFSFDGTGGSVSVPNTPELRPGQFTVSAWVRPVSFRGGGYDVVLSTGSSLWLGFASGYPVVFTHRLGVRTQASAPVQPHQWYQLAATYDGATVRLYVNGAVVAESVVTEAMTYDDQAPFAISGFWYGGQNQTYELFNGLIDEVTLHDRALTAAEMQAMVDGSTPACQVVAPETTPIRNGIPESRPQFSGVGMILPSATHGACTATLISPFTVLTAAQCFTDNTPNPVFEFSLGEGRTARVTDIRVHPLFSTADGINLAFDVAVASLDRTAASAWTDTVSATLRVNQVAPVVEATAIGFGDTSGGGRTSGALLVTSYVPGEDNNFNFLPDAFLEANPGIANQMFCRPGTGGPLFFEDQVVGVASVRNVATCAEDGPGFYVNVVHFADWIHTTAAELEGDHESTPVATTTTVSSSINPSASGQAVTFTATVGAVAATPTGDVAFVYVPTNTTLATMALVNGTAVFETSALPEGTFNIQAIFTGNSSFAGSTATLSQVVNPVASTPIRNGVPESRPQFNGVGMILPSATHGGCTATLISPFVVLTAAQCLQDASIDPVFQFSLGGGRTARVTDYRVHPYFSTLDGINLMFDVALASLDRTAVSSWTDIIPATLRADPPIPVVEASAIGFGETGTGAGSRRRTSGTLVVTQNAAGVDANEQVQPDAFLAADPGSANQMFCQAGVGGPLFYEDQIAGVASFRNVATCAEDGPGFYINTSRFADWIHTTAIALVNRPPTTNVIGDQISFEGQPIIRDALASDPDLDAITLTVQGLPSFITVTQQTPRSVSFSGTPPVGSAGTYPFTLTVSDGIVEIVQHRNWIVRRPNHPPVAVDDTFSVAQFGSTVNVLDNDSDPDGNALTLVSVGGAAHGAAQVGSGGSITYLGFGAPPYDEHLTYTIWDEFGATATASVTLHVLGNFPDVSVTVIPEPASILTGQRPTFRVRVRNLSMLPSSPATLIVDPVPGMSATFTPPPDFPAAWRWSLGVLSPAETVDVVVTLSPAFVDLFVSWTLHATLQSFDDVRPFDNTSTGVVTVYPDFCFASRFGQLARMPFDPPSVLANVVTGQGATGTPSLSLVPDSYRSGGIRFTRSSAFAPATRLGLRQSLQAAFVPIVPGEFTFSVWIKPADLLETGEEPVMSQAGLNTEIFYWLGFKSGRPVLVTRHENGTTVETTGTSTVSLNAWHHLAGTYDGSTARLYLDGVLEAATTIGVPILSHGHQAGDILIGPAPWSPAPGLSAEMDEATMYGRALAASEISATFGGPAGGCAVAANFDVAVTINAAPGVAPAGGPVALTITATNLGSGLTPDIDLTHVLPPGFTLFRTNVLAPTPSVQSEPIGPSWLEFVYHLGAMAPGQSLTVKEEVVAPDADGRYVSTAAVTPGGANTANDLAQAAIVVEPADCYATHAAGNLEPCPVNERPALQNPGPQTNRSGDQVQLDLDASDDHGPLSFLATGLPSGLAIDAVSGRISGVVANNAVSSPHVRVYVTDGTGTVHQEFTWTIRQRLTLTVGRGAVVRANSNACDARAADTTCTWEFEAGAHVSLTIDSLPELAGTTPWLEEDGVQFTAPLSAIVMNRPRTFSYWALMPFTVRFAGPVVRLIAEQLISGSAPMFFGGVGNFGNHRDALACSFDPADGCTGRAPIYSTVQLSGLENYAVLFDGFTGACEGPSCGVTLSRAGLVVTANYHGRPQDIRLEARQNAVIKLQDLTLGSEQICSAEGLYGNNCVFQVPYNDHIRVTPVLSGGWSHWRWYGYEAGLTPTDDALLDLTVFDPRQFILELHAALSVRIDGFAWNGVGYSPVSAYSNANGQSGNLLCHAIAGDTVCAGSVTAFTSITLIGDYYYVRGFTGACNSTDRHCEYRSDAPVADVVALISNPPPIRINFLHPWNWPEDNEPLPIYLQSIFRDPEDEALTYSASSSVSGLVSFQIDNGAKIVRILPVADAFGVTTITIVATDPAGGSISDSFELTIFPVNDPPRIDFIADRTIPSGVQSLIPLSGVAAGPPNEAGQHITITATANAAQFTGPIVLSNGVLHVTPPARSTSITLYVRVVVEDDGGGPDNRTERAFWLTIMPSNTLPGTNVVVNPTGPATLAPVTLTFAGVTAPGQSTYGAVTGVFQPPDGFRFGTPPVTLDISTTANYTAPVRVCITYSASAFKNPAGVRLFHYEGFRWVDRTVSVNTQTHVVCASVSSLSPFAIAEPEDLEGRMSGGGQLSVAGVDYRFDFHIAERHIGDERGHLDLTITTAKSGKKKESRDEFKATAIDAINFWDDPAFAPGRWNRPRPQADSAVFTGTGKWNGVSGYTFEARATDQGEPGRGRDTFTITIRDVRGAVVASVDGLVSDGDIQSERLKKENWR